MVWLSVVGAGATDRLSRLREVPVAGAALFNPEAGREVELELPAEEGLAEAAGGAALIPAAWVWTVLVDELQAETKSAPRAVRAAGKATESFMRGITPVCSELRSLLRFGVKKIKVCRFYISTLKYFDMSEFNDLYQRFHKPILRYVLQRLPQAEAAEEVTQEVFLKAYRARDSYRPEYALSTWLWTIARNTICDWRRKHSAMTGAAISELSCEELPAQGLDAEASLIERSRRRELLRRIRKLTRLQRRVIRMRTTHHFSYAEIAEKLGLSLDSVKCSLYRARAVLSLSN